MPQLEQILEILASATHDGGVWCGGHPQPEAGWLDVPEPPIPNEIVLMADLSFAPAMPEYDRMIGKTANCYGRLTDRVGLMDAWVASGLDENTGATLPNAATRIDHLFFSSSLAE